MSLETGFIACAVANATVSLHSIVIFNASAEVVQVGAELSTTVIVCLKGSLVLPQASVAVHVLTIKSFPSQAVGEMQTPENYIVPDEDVSFLP